MLDGVHRQHFMLLICGTARRKGGIMMFSTSKVDMLDDLGGCDQSNVWLADIGTPQVTA